MIWLLPVGWEIGRLGNELTITTPPVAASERGIGDQLNETDRGPKWVRDTEL